jgi:hypothetical protein
MSGSPHGVFGGVQPAAAWLAASCAWTTGSANSKAAAKVDIDIARF